MTRAKRQGRSGGKKEKPVNPMRHFTGVIEDLQFMDRVTKKVRAARTKKWNEVESVTLAICHALENSEEFTDFCEAQYPTQGKVLYRALMRAKKNIGVTYRSPEPLRRERSAKHG